MADDIQAWAEREGLPDEVVSALREHGFTSLVDIKELLTPEEVTEMFQKTKELPGKQCLQLKKAIKKLTAGESGESGGQHGLPDVSKLDLRAGIDGGHMAAAQQRKQPGQREWQTIATSRPSANKASFGESVSSLVGGVANIFWKTDPPNVETFRFILLGKTGSGKSTTGNTLLGEKMFTADVNFGAVTTTCELRKKQIGSNNFEIMDCPGLYDTSRSQEDVATDIVQAVACMHPGPHAILYVIRIGRYTAEEFGTYNRLKAIFDENVTNFIIPLFTGGDELEQSKKTLADMLKSAPKDLVQVVQECHNRCVVFNNKANTKGKEAQIKELLDCVRKMKKENGNPYCCPKYKLIGEGLEEEVAKRLEAVQKKDLVREKYIKELEGKMKEAKENIEELKRKNDEKEEELKRRELEEKKQKEREEEKLAKLAREKKLQEEIEYRDRMEKERRQREQELEKLERQRERAREELRKQEEEQRKLERRRREEEREDEERRQRAYREEMNRMKESIAKKEEEGWVEWAAKGVGGAVGAAAKWLGW